MTIKKIALLLGLFLLAVPTVFSIDNLKLNEHLDYGSDSLDGPLITGSDAQSGFVSGKTNYVIMYGEGCFNSKRQTRRTVELYNKCRSQVHFVVVDLDVQRIRPPRRRKRFAGYRSWGRRADLHCGTGREGGSGRRTSQPRQAG